MRSNQAKSLVNKIFLRKKLYSLRIEEGGKIYEHLENFNVLVTQLTLVAVPNIAMFIARLMG